MGLFSSKTTVHVASAAYNMAGDDDDHASVTKVVAINTILSGGQSLAQNIRDGLVFGPGQKQKRFFRWAKDSSIISMPKASMRSVQGVSSEQAYAGLLPLLSLGPNETLRVLSSVIDDGDVAYWAEHWALVNRPETRSGDWGCEWDVAAQQIVVYSGSEDSEEEPTELARLAPSADLLWAASAEGRKLLYLTYQIVTQDPATRLVTMGPVELFTYRTGSGNVVFDQLQSADTPESEFFPVIPLYIGRQFLDERGDADLYENMKAGYRRLTGQKIDKLLDDLKTNGEADNRDHLADLDGIYIVQGVPLNTRNKVGKEYIYRFLRTLMEKQFANEMELPVTSGLQSKTTMDNIATWNNWLKVHYQGLESSPLFGTPPPQVTEHAYTGSGHYELHIRSENFHAADMRVRWERIDESIHLGNAKRYDNNQGRELAKVGEYWIHSRTGPLLYNIGRFLDKPTEDKYVRPSYIMNYNRQVEEVNVFHQFSKNRYRKLRCVGLQHHNRVYGNTSDIVTGGAALADEEDSGFLVPLHMPTLKGLGAAKGADLSMGSSYLVFNSYKLVKRKWYQRGIFKIVMAVVGIVISILIPGAAGLGASVGIFGANAAVGVALGASAASAAIVGAIANGIAGAIVSAVVSKIGTKILGGKLGALLGTLISFVATTYGTQFSKFGNLNVNWGKILDPKNFLRLTSTVSESYSKWLQMNTEEIYGQMKSLEEESKEAIKEVESLKKDILGMTPGAIDPMILVNASEYFGESSEAFLSRTLMTGTEIAQLSFDMIENFANLSLELPRSTFSPET